MNMNKKSEKIGRVEQDGKIPNESQSKCAFNHAVGKLEKCTKNRWKQLCVKEAQTLDMIQTLLAITQICYNAE